MEHLFRCAEMEAYGDQAAAARHPFSSKSRGEPGRKPCITSLREVQMTRSGIGH